MFAIVRLSPCYRSTAERAALSVRVSPLRQSRGKLPVDRSRRLRRDWNHRFDTSSATIATKPRSVGVIRSGSHSIRVTDPIDRFRKGR